MVAEFPGPFFIPNLVPVNLWRKSGNPGVYIIKQALTSAPPRVNAFYIVNFDFVVNFELIWLC